MPEPWNPFLQCWKDDDVFVLGGGPSLRDFDYSILKGKKVIGCNTSALVAGTNCSVCFYSDHEWFLQNYGRLESFRGWVVTHCTAHRSRTEKWIRYMERREDGLHRNALGFGGNSGVGAINLALILGARRVMLLGIDCGASPDGGHHWHDGYPQRADNAAALYRKFTVGFHSVKRDLPTVFPKSSIINLNPNSNLRIFPFMSVEDAVAGKECVETA